MLRYTLNKAIIRLDNHLTVYSNSGTTYFITSRLPLMLRILEVLGSNLGQDTGYPDNIMVLISSSRQMPE